MAKFDRLKGIAKKQIDFSRNQHNLVAVLEKGGRIVAIANNDMKKTHPSFFNGKFDKCVHAEYNVLRQVHSANKMNLYIFRFRRNGEMGCSKPCSHCYDYIKDKGVSSIIYIKNGSVVKETLYY